MPLDPAIAALAGTALGAVLGGTSAWLIEQTRWNRQLSTRWDEIKLGRYAELFVMMDEFSDLMMIAKLHDHYSEGDDIAKVEESTADWKRAAKQFSSIGARLNELEIIASPVVSRAAYGWWRAARAYEDADRDDRPLYRKQLEFAKQVFVEAAKSELLGSVRRRRFSTKSHRTGLEAVDDPLAGR